MATNEVGVQEAAVQGKDSDVISKEGNNLYYDATIEDNIAIIKNKYTNSSGSLIAALNLTIDSAPTNPKDNARELLTIIITMQVATPKTTKFFENSILLESVEENFI